MVNNAPRGASGQYNQLRRHLVCDAQSNLRRVALRHQLTRGDEAARSQNGVRPSKYALTFNSALKSLRFARPPEIRGPVSIRPRTPVQEKELGVARHLFRRNVKRACIAVRSDERNEDAYRFSRDHIHFCLCHISNSLLLIASLSQSSLLILLAASPARRNQNTWR